MGALTRTGLGMSPQPPPDMMLQRWAQGVTAEPVILRWLEGQGYELAHTGDSDQLELEPDVAGKVKIRCHPDGVALRMAADKFPEKSFVVEAKALRPSFPRDFAPYKWQMSVEMAASGLPGLWVYGVKDEDGIVREFELKEQGEPAFSLLDIKKRALSIYRSIVNSDIPECDVQQFPCG